MLQPSLARALGVRAALGRFLVDTDAGEGERVAALSHAFWQRQFGGDSAVLGQRITLSDVQFTIVGVMASDFAFPEAGVDVWFPLRDASLNPEQRTSHNYQVIARLAPTATLESAQAEMTAIAEALAVEYPAPMTGWGVNVDSLHDDLTAAVRPLFLVLLAGVAVLLLIACACDAPPDGSSLDPLLIYPQWVYWSHATSH